MPAGLQVINNSGVLQIDSTYRNFSLLRSGSVTPAVDPNPGANSSSRIAQIAFSPSANELIAVACEDLFGPYWAKPGIQAFRVVGTSQLRYYVFGVKSSSDGYGLQVFNAAGTLAFDSSWKPFNVAGVITSGSVTLAAGRTPAVLFISQATFSRGDIVAQNPNSWIFQRSYGGGMAQISGRTANSTGGMMWQVFQEGGFPSDPPASYNYSNGVTNRLMVLDVTGY